MQRVPQFIKICVELGDLFMHFILEVIDFQTVIAWQELELESVLDSHLYSP